MLKPDNVFIDVKCNKNPIPLQVMDLKGLNIYFASYPSDASSNYMYHEVISHYHWLKIFLDKHNGMLLSGPNKNKLFSRMNSKFNVEIIEELITKLRKAHLLISIDQRYDAEIAFAAKELIPSIVLFYTDDPYELLDSLPLLPYGDPWVYIYINTPIPLVLNHLFTTTKLGEQLNVEKET